VRYSVGGPYPPNRVTPGPRQGKLFLLDYVRVTELLTDFEIFQDIKNRFFFLCLEGATWKSRGYPKRYIIQSWRILENFLYVLRGGKTFFVCKGPSVMCCVRCLVSVLCCLSDSRVVLCVLGGDCPRTFLVFTMPKDLSEL